MRILSIDGTDSLGMPVPEWQHGISTPLRPPQTLGQRVRARRRATRAEVRLQDRNVEDQWLKERRQRALMHEGVEDAFTTESYPISEDELLPKQPTPGTGAQTQDTITDGRSEGGDSSNTADEADKEVLDPEASQNLDAPADDAQAPKDDGTTGRKG